MTDVAGNLTDYTHPPDPEQCRRNFSGLPIWGRLACIAEWPFFVWPAYIFFVLPMSMYILHDVIDTRWRSRHIRRFWYSAYSVLNFVFMFSTTFYLIVQIAAQDHKESAAIVVAFGLNVYAALKVARGLMINRMLFLLGIKFRLVSAQNGERYEEYAGPLAEQVASTFMDDDYPGDSPRIRWNFLLLMTYLSRQANVVHRSDIIIDFFEYVLMVYAWAWRSFCQVSKTMNECEHLWWLVSGLDRASVTSLMAAFGKDFQDLDTKFEYTNVGDVDLSCRLAYHPLNVHPVIIPDNKQDLDNFASTRTAFKYILKTLHLSVACVLGKRTMNSQYTEFNTKEASGFVLVHDSQFQRGRELRSIGTAAAESQLVHLMHSSVRLVSSRIMRILYYILGHAETHPLNVAIDNPVIFTKAVLNKAIRQEHVDPANRSVKFDSKGKPVYNNWQARHLKFKSNMESFKLQHEDAERYFQSLGQAVFEVEKVPAFLAAYCTSLVAILDAASLATPSEQLEAISNMPANVFFGVGTVRLSFVGALSTYRQLARIWMSHLSAEGPSRAGWFPQTVSLSRLSFQLAPRQRAYNARSLRRAGPRPDGVGDLQSALGQPGDLESEAEAPRVVDKAWSTCLVRSCAELLEVGDDLMLHVEHMAGVGLERSWERVESRVSVSQRSAVRELIDLFQELGKDGLLQSAFDKANRQQFQARTYLWDHCLENLALMMAITFASVMCGAKAMMAGRADGRQEVSVENARDGNVLLAAMHHAVCLGWEYILWQAQHAARIPCTQQELRNMIPEEVLAEWGISGEVDPGGTLTLSARQVSTFVHALPQADSLLGLEGESSRGYIEYSEAATPRSRHSVAQPEAVAQAQMYGHPGHPGTPGVQPATVPAPSGSPTKDRYPKTRPHGRTNGRARTVSFASHDDSSANTLGSFREPEQKSGDPGAPAPAKEQHPGWGPFRRRAGPGKNVSLASRDGSSANALSSFYAAEQKSVNPRGPAPDPRPLDLSSVGRQHTDGAGSQQLMGMLAPAAAAKAASGVHAAPDSLKEVYLEKLGLHVGRHLWMWCNRCRTMSAQLECGEWDALNGYPRVVN